ncbi:MAG TPA: sigma-70 family RNA polymerase sigma factor [Nannocystaceae bacterium]|nr:sigma-70 family RNA polymerase sigma factor [Nannocystaceae bacterium]
MSAANRAAEIVGERPEDTRLMELVASGDPRARSMLAMRLCSRVRRLLRGLLGDARDADDAAQDALVEILLSAHGYRGEASIERWADRIAVRTGVRFRRRERRASVDVAIDPEQLRAPAPEPAHGDALPRPLVAYLDELPLEERQVLFLKHGLGYSLPEVAELVGARGSTTKYRLMAALARVRKLIRRDTALGRRGGAS